MGDYVKAHGGGEGADYLEFFMEHQGCAGCLYQQYKLTQHKEADGHLDERDTLPRIWCTQVLGFSCTNYECDTNLFADPFRCRQGNSAKQYSNMITEVQVPKEQAKWPFGKEFEYYTKLHTFNIHNIKNSYMQIQMPDPEDPTKF